MQQVRWIWTDLANNETTYNDTVPLVALRAAADVYYNYTGSAGACYNQGTTANRREARSHRLGGKKPQGPAASLGFDGQAGWGYRKANPPTPIDP